MRENEPDRPFVIGWRRLRAALGALQVAGGIVATGMLLDQGATTSTLAVIVVTGTLTSMSVVLFGSYRG